MHSGHWAGLSGSSQPELTQQGRHLTGGKQLLEMTQHFPQDNHLYVALFAYVCPCWSQLLIFFFLVLCWFYCQIAFSSSSLCGAFYVYWINYGRTTGGVSRPEVKFGSHWILMPDWYLIYFNAELVTEHLALVPVLFNYEEFKLKY